MKCTKYALSALWLTVVFSAAAAAQEIYVFPNKGQSQEQQNRDRGECDSWAKGQTGYNPAAAASGPPPSGQAPQGGVVRGGLRGAAAGAAVGAIAGDAGKGAAIGAASGGMLGGMKRSDQRRQEQASQEQWQQQQQAAYGEYRRALSACLEGKGYTVK